MSITVDGTRLWCRLQESARYGATVRGGLRRLALSDADKQARDRLVHWAHSRNFVVTVDRIGNIFIRRPGRSPELPPVMTGSHLDTTPTGGRFDGIFGVLAGLEILETLEDHGISTRRSIEVVNWTNEEGIRFTPAMLGSMAFSGVLELAEALEIRDASGMRLGDALERIGYAGAGSVPGAPPHAFIEAHIEQGPVLEEQQYPIGIVTGVQGQVSLNVSVRGVEAHSGSTPMSLRHDALVAAAEMSLAVQSLTVASASDAVGTVGFFEVSPGARNTVPGNVEFSVDLRVPEESRLLKLEQRITEQFKSIAEARQVGLTFERVWMTAPLSFSATCIESLQRSAAALKLPALSMISGAGHDACQLHSIAPTGMLFVPCEHGISHNEAEYARPEDLTRGANLLLHSLLELAES